MSEARESGIGLTLHGGIHSIILRLLVKRKSFSAPRLSAINTARCACEKRIEPRDWEEQKGEGRRKNETGGDD